MWMNWTALNMSSSTISSMTCLYIQLYSLHIGTGSSMYIILLGTRARCRGTNSILHLPLSILIEHLHHPFLILLYTISIYIYIVYILYNKCYSFELCVGIDSVELLWSRQYIRISHMILVMNISTSKCLYVMHVPILVLWFHLLGCHR